MLETLFCTLSILNLFSQISGESVTVTKCSHMLHAAYSFIIRLVRDNDVRADSLANLSGDDSVSSRYPLATL